MSTSKTLAIATIIAGSASVAQAAHLDYATGVDYMQGEINGNTDSSRYMPESALGAPDEQFLSLGLGGQAEFSFDTPRFGSPASVFEVTFNNPGDQPESAKVFGVAADGSTEWLTGINNTDAQEGASFEFSGAFEKLLVEDNTVETYGPNAASKDGFDIDAVGVSPVPVPAAGLLLAGALGGIGGFGAMRRKRSA